MGSYKPSGAKLISFENKILINICGPIYDEDSGCCGRKTNKFTDFKHKVYIIIGTYPAIIVKQLPRM